MKLQLAIRSSKERIEVDAEPFSIRMKDSAFAVVVPFFDDWQRTLDYDLRAADAVIGVEHGTLIIQFPDDAARSRFKAWLVETNAKAEHGYNTMWP